MRISQLTVLLAIQMIAWCVLGTIVHGWQILCYPAAWLGIATGFGTLNYVYDLRHAPAARAVSSRSTPELKRPIDRSAKATANAN